MNITKIGNKFGRWRIIKQAGKAGPFKRWICECDCGERKIVQDNNLRSGRSKSCGCLNREITASLCKKRSLAHGLTKTPEYRTWIEMKRRCYAKHRKEYKNYGLRGISVCKRWENSFENFLKDMGSRPFLGATLDRKNNNKGYSPQNCRWATVREQNKNKRNTLAM